MKLRPLIIDEEAKAEVARVVAYAKEHPYNLHDIHRLMVHPEDAPGHTAGFVTVLKVGYRCVFTIDQHPAGWMRHISVSVMDKELAPNPEAMQEIIKLFGFKGRLRDCTVHVMKERYASVNVLELLEEQP